MSEEKSLHEINGYFYNVMNLLKFIQKDAVIENIETKKMLDMAVLKEGEIIKALSNLKKDSQS